MIYRFMFVGYSQTPEKVTLKENTGCYTALSRYENWLYLYVEANSEAVDPNGLAEGPLVPFPDGICWDRASEIFHYSKPMHAGQWNRKVENKMPYIRHCRLLPEKISSYIYYHYQLHGVIYLFRDTLIFYSEIPDEMETEPHAPGLPTHDSPRKTWDKVMAPHFNGSWVQLALLKKTEFIPF